MAWALRLSGMTMLLCPFKKIPLQIPNSSLKLKYGQIVSGYLVDESGKPSLMCCINSCMVWSLYVCWQILSTESELNPVNSSMLCTETFSSDGDGVLESNGVAKYSTNASLQDCFAIVQCFINNLTILIAFSAGLPLWWYALENVRLIPRCWQSCWKTSDTKFLPLS